MCITIILLPIILFQSLPNVVSINCPTGVEFGTRIGMVSGVGFAKVGDLLMQRATATALDRWKRHLTANLKKPSKVMGQTKRWKGMPQTSLGFGAGPSGVRWLTRPRGGMQRIKS